MVRPGLTTAVVGMVFLLGCRSEPPRGQVEGVVRCQGQVLANVLVTFLPDPAKGTLGARSSGKTDEKGRYRLGASDPREGPVVGWHKVVVEDLAINEAPRDPDGTLKQPVPVRFHRRFGEAVRTPLQLEVRPENQTLNLELFLDP